MAFTYDSTTTAGLVRLLITDTDPEEQIFEDDEISAFLALESDDALLAAAQALETIATSEALVQKRIQLLDLSTDGPAVAKSLMERAASLRKRARQVELEGEGAFDWAEMAVDDFSARERIWNEALRNQ
jgi:hypothetical protein